MRQGSGKWQGKLSARPAHGAVGGFGKSGNLNTTLRKRQARDPMRDYDALPAELRAWLSRACLPWSPRSVRRLWKKALERCAGDRARAIALLEEAETKSLARDMRRIWGEGYPLT